MAKIDVSEGDPGGGLEIRFDVAAVGILACGDQLRRAALGGQYDTKLSELDAVFALAVEGCFDRFGFETDADMRLDVLMGLLQEFRLKFENPPEVDREEEV